MRKLVREHTRWVWGTFVGVATTCSLLVIFIPQLPEALASLWFAAWIYFPISVGIIIRLVQINDKYHVRLGESADRNAESKDRERASKSELELEQARSEKLSTEHFKLQTELSEAQDRIADLEKPKVTERDRRLFGRVIEEWPWNGGTLWWLENVFNAKSWSSSTASQVVLFADIEREAFFDNPTVNASFQKFKLACDTLSTWLTLESFPHPQNWDIQEVPDGNNRAGGWPEFDALRYRGKGLAYAVVDARREFEQVGRSQGL